MPDHLTLLLAGLAACVAVVLAACGDDNGEPKPDRDQIIDVVTGFLHDVVDDDAAAVCASLTPTGRARAIGRGRTIGKPLKPASLEECVSAGASAATSSGDLPELVGRNAIRVTHSEIDGASARVVLANGALKGVQRLKKTSDGWKIDQFELPVRD